MTDDNLKSFKAQFEKSTSVDPPPVDPFERKRKESEREESEGAKTQHGHGANGGQDTEDPEEKFFRELLAKYNAALLTSEELETEKIEPRAALLGEWLRESDLGFIYGERGSGKTWLVAGIATSVSTGTDLDSWKALEAFPVLYVDGEMPMDLTRDRLQGLAKKNKNLTILHHEHLFNVSDCSMNIADPTTQKVILEICVTKKIKLLILDNLSCLASGVKENDADEWEKLLNWLLDLRRRRIAVIIVHHAGAAGLRMRGTTKREDNAAWVIKVAEVKDDPSPAAARFETSFTKRGRSTTGVEWDRKWVFKTENDGSVSIGCEEVSFEGKVLQRIQDGLETASQIAEDLGCSLSTASKFAKRLAKQNLIEIKKRHYFSRGFMDEK